MPSRNVRVPSPKDTTPVTMKGVTLDLASISRINPDGSGKLDSIAALPTADDFADSDAEIEPASPVHTLDLHIERSNEYVVEPRNIKEDNIELQCHVSGNDNHTHIDDEQSPVLSLDEQPIMQNNIPVNLTLFNDETQMLREAAEAEQREAAEAEQREAAEAEQRDAAEAEQRDAAEAEQREAAEAEQREAAEAEQLAQRSISRHAPVHVPESEQQLNVSEQRERYIPVQSDVASGKYDNLTDVEMAKIRAAFIIKFGSLRELYKSYSIPEIQDSQSLDEIDAMYREYVKHTHIGKGAGRNKAYLLVGWLIIELFCVKMGLDAGGFTMSQITSMNKYEELLLELGESSYDATGNADFKSKWSVESRIIFVSMGSLVSTIIVKTLAGYVGNEAIASILVDALTGFISGDSPMPGNVGDGIPSASSTPGSVPARSSGLNTANLAEMAGAINYFRNMVSGGGSRAAPTQDTRSRYNE